MKEEDKILLKDEEGIEKEYYKLIQFKDKNTNKRFIIYTDNNKDENGKLNIYSNIIEEHDGSTILKAIREEEDLEKVKLALINAKLNY